MAKREDFHLATSEDNKLAVDTLGAALPIVDAITETRLFDAFAGGGVDDHATR